MGLQLSGSVQLEGNLLVTGSANSVFENISVTNRITANEINVQFVSSSIIYSSGSNKFGDLITDTQQFTGSVDVSGSLTATTLVRRGGTSSQFLMADGSVNTSVSASGAYLPLSGGTLTGDLNGTSAVFSGYITGQGNNPGGLGGSRYVLDWVSGQMRLFSYGANSSTNGGFLFNSQRSDGTNSINYLDIASTGAATFSSSVGVGGSISGNYPLTIRSTAADFTKILDWGTGVGGSWGTMTINIDAPYQTIFNSGGGFAFTGGNVGIGTDSPVAPVHVVGTVEANGSLYRGVFGGTSAQDADMTGLTGGNGSELQIQSPTTTRGAFLTLGGGMAFGEAMGGMAFYNSNNVDGKRCRAFIVGGQDGATAGEQGSYLSFGTVDNTGTTPSEGMRLTRLGRLGIGIDNPVDRLVVNGNLGVTDGSFASGESYSLYLGDKNAFMNSTFGERVRLGAFNGFDFGFAEDGDLSLSSTWMSIDGSGRVGINYNNSAIHTYGSSAYSAPLTVKAPVANALTLLNSTTGGDAQVAINFVNEFVSGQYNYIARIIAEPEGAWDSNASTRDSRLSFFTTLNGVTDEAMRITSERNVLFQKQAANNTETGAGWFLNDYFCVTNNSADAGDRVVLINRENSDGELIEFRQGNVAEGDITISGTTVSYNGGHLSRYSQTELNEKIEGLLKGTVMSNLDQMAEWINPETGEPYENEQLNCMKISDVEGDKNVAGVFVNWQYDSELSTNDMNIAMTGDMIIRIAEGVVVEKGDLLISAGDGTAKPQSDDLIRSNTIGKVISNHVTCVYEDGSYCVPCVLMAC